MRDIIWTIIIIWLVYKIADIFRNASSKKQNAQSFERPTSPTDDGSTVKAKNIKNAVRGHADNEGEYVDFEEVK